MVPLLILYPSSPFFSILDRSIIPRKPIATTRCPFVNLTPIRRPPLPASSNYREPSSTSNAWAKVSWEIAAKPLRMMFPLWILSTGDCCANRLCYQTNWKPLKMPFTTIISLKCLSKIFPCGVTLATLTMKTLLLEKSAVVRLFCFLICTSFWVTMAIKLFPPK